MSSSFGKLFNITTWGESHGKGLGVVIDGCPPNIPLSAEDFAFNLRRRMTGQSQFVTSRKEPDEPIILSGVFEGKTLGTPIAVLVENADQRPSSYSNIKDILRPSHADFTYLEKYGIRAYQGGGRASARETVARVIAGSLAKKLLEKKGILTRAYVSQIGEVKLEKQVDFSQLVDFKENTLRCPDDETEKKMQEHLLDVKSQGDSTGGVITCKIRGVPTGLGEPIFDRLNADLAKAMFSIPAVKGFEMGLGFDSCSMRGSTHNDSFILSNDPNKKLTTKTNNSAGIQGGISNGEEIYFRVAFKPTATIFKEQKSVDVFGNELSFQAQGRHDPCVVPRAVVIVESMVNLVLVDHLMRQNAQRNTF